MKKALIIIDLERGFVTKYTRQIPSRIKSFIDKKGANYDLILFTQYKNHSTSNFVKNLGYKGFMSKEEYGIVEELEGFVNKNNLFTKDTYSSFVNNKLPHTLKRKKIVEVHLAGIDTENCVLTFARDAFDRGYRVVVLKGLCGSHSDPVLHKAALKIIRNNIGEVR